MVLKICELISILLSALISGVFWGPWLSLTRSNATLKPDLFLAIAHRMTGNLASVMRILMPAAMLSIAAVLLLSYRGGGKTFYLTLAGLVLLLVALLVTVIVEVPIVKQILAWTATTLPGNWQQLRDRWGAFHVIRMVASFAALTFLVIAAIF